ncbi:hypothetical protein G9A89_013147 [Geosiphon pyriformis]|nr:hypothetical protein G9A89_013147 [Geosiphon pyriformis]
MNELTINISELTRKKKKAKIDFILDPNKASTSTANNNESLKAKLTIRCGENKKKDQKDQEEQKETAELTYIIFTKSLIENLTKKPNTVIGDMVFVLGVSVINLCIPLIMNTSPV